MSSHAPEVPRSSICLNMIVKNEAHVIARCIKSVKPHITSWVIVDTGSTDGTQELIKELLKDIPGELHERPWKDFSANRNEAIELARGKADYLMVVDADDVIVGACPHRLIHSHYMLTVEDGGIVYDRCHIFKSTLPFHYVGVLHEYLECKTPGLNPVKLPSLKYRRYHEGARSKDKKDTYLRDAAILTAALETEKDEYLQRRYAFYLANSYKDAGEPEKAIDAYEKRAVMGGGFIEEIFISLLYVAELKASLDRPEDEVEKAYLRAYESRPGRIEAIHDLCVYLRLKEKYQKAYLYAKGVMDKKHTTDTLFVNEQVYRWKMLDETAVAAFYCGEKDVSRTICEELLQNQFLPRQEVPRIENNRRLASAIGELTFPETNIPENKEPSGMGEVLDRMRENVGAGGTELGAMLTLFSLAVSIRAETLVEIGRFRGAGTFALASALKFLRIGWKEPPEAHQRREINYSKLENPVADRKLFSIEKFPLPETKEMLHADGLDPFITYIDKSSTDVTPADLGDRMIDLLFVDGDHSYNGCMNDVLKFLPMIRPGGMWICHDYVGWIGPDGENGSPIKQVCDVLEKDFEHLLIDTHYVSFMIFRKKS